jgi:hypothetical protein
MRRKSSNGVIGDLVIASDGQVRNTALFVASQAVKSMTQEEIATMFLQILSTSNNVSRYIPE